MQHLATGSLTNSLERRDRIAGRWVRRLRLRTHQSATCSRGPRCRTGAQGSARAIGQKHLRGVARELWGTKGWQTKWRRRRSSRLATAVHNVGLAAGEQAEVLLDAHLRVTSVRQRARSVCSARPGASDAESDHPSLKAPQPSCPSSVLQHSLKHGEQKLKQRVQVPGRNAHAIPVQKGNTACPGNIACLLSFSYVPGIFQSNPAPKNFTLAG
eukprot:6189855-Pleurochrysis_carterae.AAC.1